MPAISHFSALSAVGADIGHTECGNCILHNLCYTLLVLLTIHKIFIAKHCLFRISEGSYVVLRPTVHTLNSKKLNNLWLNWFYIPGSTFGVDASPSSSVSSDSSSDHTRRRVSELQIFIYVGLQKS